MGKFINLFLGFFSYQKKRPVILPVATIKSKVTSIKVPQLPDEKLGWKGYPAFKGRTPNLEFISCHSSVLSPGKCPHPPHEHREEELLILLYGEVKLILSSEEKAGLQDGRRLLPGQFVYYPAFFPHTLETVSSYPSNYLMFKWSSKSPNEKPQIPYNLINGLYPLQNQEKSNDFTAILNFEGPTLYCRKLHSHTTYLLPGGGYKKHKDLHDVAIVMLDGEAVTNDILVKPFDVIYYPAGELHDIYNHHQKPTRYLVFEFHGY